MPGTKLYSLRKKCPYAELFWPLIHRIRTRKTPNEDTFHAVIVLLQNVTPWIHDLM